MEILVNVLQFSSDCHWMYDAPVNIESFWWIPIKANGLTNFGDACRELNNAMSKDKLFSYNNIYSGYMPSVIFLITDGAPTDEYISNMEKLWNNPFFRISKKFAIGLNDEISSETLTLFTKNKKRIFIVKDENINDLSSIITRLLTMSLYSVSMSSLSDE